jgi:hypothetical protein
MIRDCSGTTSATPSTATTAISANNRSSWMIQNVSTTATIWINDVGTASSGSGSVMLLPGSMYSPPDGVINSGAVSILSATASVPYTAREW